MKKMVLLFVAFLALNACSKNENDRNATAVSKAAPVSVKQSGTVPARQAAGQSTKNIFVSYTPVEAQKLIKQRQDLLIVDVRTPQELREGKLEDSILVPFWSVMKSKHQIPRNRPLLLVCAVGGRSYAAMQMLARQGYTEIYNLKGGMSAWKSSRLPVMY